MRWLIIDIQATADQATPLKQPIPATRPLTTEASVTSYRALELVWCRRIGIHHPLRAAFSHGRSMEWVRHKTAV